jgi:hypothetical protein
MLYRSNGIKSRKSDVTRLRPCAPRICSKRKSSKEESRGRLREGGRRMGFAKCRASSRREFDGGGKCPGAAIVVLVKN